MYRLPPGLIVHLKEKNITHLAHIVDIHNSTFLQQASKTVGQFNIPPPWRQHWWVFTQTLLEAHIHITEGEDEIIWALEKSGRYTPKEGYLVLANPRKSLVILQWWKLKARPRSRVLMWCILKNKIPTGIIC